MPAGVKSSDVISDWALDALLRRRAYENAEGSKETLNSIVSLVHQIEGMPVEQDVTDDVRGALDALDKVRVSSLDNSISSDLMNADVYNRTRLATACSAVLRQGVH